MRIRRLAKVAVLALAVLFARPVASHWRADALDTKASALLAGGRADAAILLSLRATRLAPASAAYRLTLAAAHGAMALRQKSEGWKERAVDQYLEAARLSPLSHVPWARLGRFHTDWQAATGDDEAGDAIAALAEALIRYPTSWWLRRDLGYAFLMGGLLEAAEGELTQSLAMHVDVETLCLLGMVQERNGSLAEARSSYSRLLEIEPNHEVARNRLELLGQ
jgi:tetratricopeptide (TPR) repeat protein